MHSGGSAQLMLPVEGSDALMPPARGLASPLSKEQGFSPSPSPRNKGNSGGGRDFKTFGVTEKEDSTLKRFATRFREGIFGVLYIMAKDTKSSPSWTLFFLFIDFAQLMAFAFNPGTHFPWGGRYLSWLKYLLLIIDFEYYVALNLHLKVIVYVFCYSVVTIILGLAAFVGYTMSASRNRFQSVWLLRALRSVAPLFVTFLFIPILKIFVSVLKCPFTDNCWTGMSLVLNIVTIFLSVFFIAFSLFVAGTFFNPDPTASTDFKARPHSRVDLLYVTIRSVLSISFGLLKDTSFHWLLVALLLIGAALGSYGFTRYLSYYNFWFCQVRSACFWIFLWAGLCLAVTVGYADEQNGGPGLLLLGGLPFVVFTSVLCCRSRRSWVESTPISQLNDQYEVEMKIRWLLAEPTEAQHLHGTTFEARLRDEEFQERLQQAEEWFQQAELIPRLSANCLFYIFQAQFFFTYRQDYERVTECLNKCERLSPQPDEQFIVYRLRRVVEAESSAAVNAGDVAARRESADVILQMSIKRYKKEAQYYIKRFSTTEEQFWSELLKTYPNLEQLYESGLLFNRSLSLAEENLKALMKISVCSQDPQVLRMYGVFLFESNVDRREGLAMIEKAERSLRKQRKAKRDERERRRLRLLAAQELARGVRQRISGATSAPATPSGKRASVTSSTNRAFDLTARRRSMAPSDGSMPASSARDSVPSAVVEGGQQQQQQQQQQPPQRVRHASQASVGSNAQQSQHIAQPTARRTSLAMDYAVDEWHKGSGGSATVADESAMNKSSDPASPASSGKPLLELPRQTARSDSPMASKAAFRPAASAASPRSELSEGVALHSDSGLRAADDVPLVDNSARREEEAWQEDGAKSPELDGAEYLEQKERRDSLKSSRRPRLSLLIPFVKGSGMSVPTEAFMPDVAQPAVVEEPTKMRSAPPTPVRKNSLASRWRPSELQVRLSLTKPTLPPELESQLPPVATPGLTLDTGASQMGDEDRKLSVDGMTMFSRVGGQSVGLASGAALATPGSNARSHTSRSIRRRKTTAHVKRNSAVSEAVKSDSSDADVVSLLRSWTTDRADHGTKLMRQLFIATIVAFLSLAIAWLVLSQQALNTYSDTVRDIRAAQHGSYLSLSLASTLRSLELVNRGLLPGGREAQEKAQLSQYAEELEQLCDRLRRRVGAIDAEHAALFRRPSIALAELHDGWSLASFARRWNLVQAMLGSASKARLLASSALPTLDSRADSNTFLLVRNAPDSFLQALNYSAFMYASQAEEVREQERVFSVTFIAVSLVFIVCMFAAVFAPITVRVTAQTDDVLRVFLELPRHVVKRFHKRSQHRLEVAHMMLNLDAALDLEREDDVGDEDVAEERREAEAAEEAAEQARRNAREKKAFWFRSEQDLTAVANAPGGGAQQAGPAAAAAAAAAEAAVAAGSAKRPPKVELRQRRTAHRARNFTLVRIASLFVVSLIFFVLFFFWPQLIGTGAGVGRGFISRSLASELNYSGLRRVLSRAAFVKVRDFLVSNATTIPNATVSLEAAPANAGYNVLNVDLQDALTTLEWLRTVQKAVMFGSAELGMDGSAAQTGDLARLMQSDACSFLNEPDCGTFYNKLFTQGLAAAVEEYLRLASQVLRQPFSAVVNSSLDRGFTVGEQVTLRLSEPSFRFLEDMDSRLQSRALDVATDMYERSILRTVAALYSQRQALAVTFTILLPLLYMLYYSSMLHHLEGDIKRTRSMLLLLPPSLMRSIDAVRNYLEKMREDAQRKKQRRRR